MGEAPAALAEADWLGNEVDNGKVVGAWAHEVSRCMRNLGLHNVA